MLMSHITRAKAEVLSVHGHVNRDLNKFGT